MTGRRWFWTWLALAAVSAVLALHAWPAWPRLIPPCTVRRFTGLHCPGCGGTRSAVSLLQGDLAGALAMNAAVAGVTLVFAGVITAGVWQEWRGGNRQVFPSWLAWSLSGVVVVFGMVRNLPWWPFTLLVPQG